MNNISNKQTAKDAEKQTPRRLRAWPGGGATVAKAPKGRAAGLGVCFYSPFAADVGPGPEEVAERRAARFGVCFSAPLAAAVLCASLWPRGGDREARC